jgi:hypothetical protein
LLQRWPRIVDKLAQSGFGTRRRIGGADLQSFCQKECCPACPDNAGPDDGNAIDLFCHALRILAGARRVSLAAVYNSLLPHFDCVVNLESTDITGRRSYIAEMNSFIRALGLAAAASILALLLRLPTLADEASTNAPASTPPPVANLAGSVNIPEDGKWHASVTPYVFVPQINGTFQIPVSGLGNKHAPVTLNLNEPPSSYVPHINALSMTTAEVRKSTAVASFDYIWLNISTQKAGVLDVSSPKGVFAISGNAGFRVTANIWTTGVGDTIAHSDTATVETLIGVRQLNLNTALNWNSSVPLPVLPQSGTVAKSGTVTDIVGEVRGKVRLGSRFFFPYYFDGGYGNGSSTVQAAAGLAYDERWGNILLVYRALIYNANPLSLNQRLTFNGLTLGTTFRF